MKCVKQFSRVLLVTFVLISAFGPNRILANENAKPILSDENTSTEVNSKEIEDESCSLTAVQCNPPFTGHQAFFQLGIKRVAFGTIDNTTSVPGQGDPTLHDFTCTQQTNITAGVPESITVTNFTHNQEAVKVYIDYNNDGDFNDAGELAFSSDKDISHTGSITAPLTAVNNTVLRMRVLSDFFDNGIASACENIDFGQVEEYGVTVLVPVITSTSSGQAVNDNATIDPFSGVVLTILGNPNVTATITLDNNAKGTLSGTDLVGSGPYTIASKSLSDMQAAIRALTFTPTENRSATTETTTFTISINDGTTTSNDSNTTVISSAVGPNITGISIPNTPMKVGDVVTATITVSSDVDDYTTGSGGISGTIGGFALGSLSRTNATTYTAAFTVTDGGTDVAAGSDIPVSVTLTDSGGKAGNTFGTAINQASDAIDANRPNLNSIVITDQALKAGETTLVTFTFSEVVTGFANADITIPNGTMTDVSSSDGGTTYTATFTPTADLEDATNIFTVDKSGVSDNAGNAGTGTTNSGNFTIDTQKPTVTITASANPTSGAFTATFTFSEDVTGFVLGDITVGNGAASSFNTTSASVYTATVTPSANGAVTVDVAADIANDAAGNNNTAATQLSVTNDETKPTVTITASANPTSGAFTATFTFSEDVTGFVVGDITVGNGAASNFNATSAKVYTATITPTADGAVTIDVAADKANDAAGNGNTAATQLSVTNDETKPTVTITSDANDPQSGAFTATFTFSEDVFGFGVGGITLGNGVASNFSSISATVYTATITPSVDGLVTIDVAADQAFDNPNNGNSAATQLSVTNDETNPTVTITASANPTSGAFTATFTFSEAVTGFIAGDITVGNGAVSNFNATSASVYTATITPAADGAVTIDVAADKAQDAAGNNNTTATQLSVTNDETKPTVAITSTNTSGAALAEFPVTITFSESVTGFVEGDITLSNGMVKTGTFSGSGTTYTATIEGINHGTVTVDVAADKANDAAGNGNTAATQFSIENDVISPNVVITSNAANPQSGVFTATFTFDEDVTDFVQGDINVGNGAAGNFNATNAKVYTATITPAADGNVTVDVPVLAAKDIAGNFSNAATQLVVVNDETKPTVTITASADPTNGAFTATFTFSEDVTGFVVGDATIGNGTASNFNATSASVYTATITPAADGAVTIDVASDKAIDAAGNGNTAATQLSVTNDETQPTVTITASADPTSGAFTATFTFSEDVTGFVVGDITVGNGAASNFNATSASVYTATITPAADGATTVDVAADKTSDAAGNGNTAATQLSVTNDETKPTVTITSDANDPQSGAFTATFTFSEDVTGFVVGDITVGNGAASNFNATSGTLYTATITPAADGATTLDVAADKANDAAGNGNTVATQLSVTNDETKPVVTITSDANDPQSGAFTATFTFSEDVTGFTSDDISVGNGAASNFNATSATVYTATITPVADGAVTIDVAADKAQDAAGNNNTAATQLSVTNDETKPSVTISSGSTSPVNGKFTITAQFSEAVTGFVEADVSTDGGISDFTAVDANTYTFSISSAGAGANVEIGANVAADAAGNSNTASNSIALVFDITPPNAPNIDLASSSDSGSSSSDNITNVNKPTIEGTTEANASVEVFADGTSVGTTNADANGDWSITLASALSDGAREITAKATDAAENTSVSSSVLAITIDTQNPLIPSIDEVTNDNGVSNFDFITNDNTLLFSGTAEANALVEVFIGAVSIGTTSANGSGEFSFDHSGTTLTDATYTLTAKATDVAGNTSESSTSTSLIVDTDAPVPTLTSAVADITNTAFSVVVEYNETVSGFELGDISVSNGTADNFTPIIAGQKWSVDVTPTSDGNVVINLNSGVASDVSGNSSTESNEVTATFDGTAPEVVSINRKDADPLNTGTSSVDFRVIFSEDVSGVDLTDFEVVLTASATGSLNSITPVDDKTYDINVNGIGGEGTIRLNAKDDDSIMDGAGNTLSGTFTGQVYTTNKVPTDIALDTDEIDENNSVGDVVGNLSTTDVDGSDTHTYTFVSGTGDADNASFTVDGAQLKAAAVFDFETKSSYTIRVKTDDGKGGSFEKALTVNVVNVLEPSIVITGDESFPQTILGFTESKTWTITNDGEKDVEVRTTSAPTGFTVSPSSIVVAMGTSEEVTVSFTPQQPDAVAGPIVFEYDGLNISKDVSGSGEIVTSIDDGSLNKASVQTYPNPANEFVTIDLSRVSAKALDINVLDASGKPMFKTNGFKDKQLVLDVSKYRQGMYIINLSSADSVVRKKILIRR